MAIKVKDTPADGDMSVGVVGIHSPLVVTEAGHEGARAVYEYQTMAEARIVLGDKPADKYQQYDAAFDRQDDWSKDPTK